MRFTCRQCRALLPGYIQRELSPKQRSSVAHHLTSCSECYVVYTMQQQLQRELAFSVPRLGGAPRLEKMRSAVMAEVTRPADKPKLPVQAKAKLYQARYSLSLAVLVLMISLLLPLSIRNHSFSLPTPPQPEKITPQGTAVVALPPLETATLTATVQANYAPLPDGTDTP